MNDAVIYMDALAETLEKSKERMSKEDIIRFIRRISERVAAGEFDDRQPGSNVIYIHFPAGNRRV